jgi:hypothetical protein
VHGTPFGLPVVPLVNIRSQTSSGPTAAGRKAAPPPRAIRSDHPIAPSGTGPSAITMVSSAGCFVSLAASAATGCMPRNPSTVTRSRAPLRAST